VDFTDLKAQTRQVLSRYDHKNWNDFLEFPRWRTSASSCRPARERISFRWSSAVWEGNGKWAEM
jgi:6-pyruvoyl-tetrahydropterin synthase